MFSYFYKVLQKPAELQHDMTSRLEFRILDANSRAYLFWSYLPGGYLDGKKLVFLLFMHVDNLTIFAMYL